MNNVISFRNATIDDALFIAKGFHMAMFYYDASDEQISRFARNICVCDKNGIVLYQNKLPLPLSQNLLIHSSVT